MERFQPTCWHTISVRIGRLISEQVCGVCGNALAESVATCTEPCVFVAPMQSIQSTSELLVYFKELL